MPTYLVYFDPEYEIPYCKKIFASKDQAIKYFFDKYLEYASEYLFESLSCEMAEKYPSMDTEEADEIAYKQAMEKAQEIITTARLYMDNENYNPMYDDMPVICYIDEFGYVQEIEME